MNGNSALSLMNIHSLLSFLGRVPAARDFDAFLTEHRIYERPHWPEEGEEYEDDPDAAFENARESLIDEVERYSVALIYEERINYERLFGSVSGNGDFVFKQVALYAPGVRHYRGYTGDLPLGLSFSDSREIVRSKLGAPMADRIIHDMPADLFITEDLHVNVSYMDDGASIGIVHVRRPHMFDLRMIGKAAVEYDEEAIDLERLTGCLGRSAYDPELESLLEPFGWQSGDLEMADCDEVPNLIEPHGLALYYRDADEYETLSGQRFMRDGAVFAGFRVNRRGDMPSDGYGGQLPFGIEFHDTPEQAKAKVGREPDMILMGDDIGAYKWKLPAHTLHVMFSLIDYQVYRVSCFAKFMEAELFRRVA